MRDGTNSGSGEQNDGSIGRFGRRPFLKSVGAVGAAGAMGGAASGSAFASHVSQWPSPSDPYYSFLVRDLDEMGLPPADFVHGSTETETLNAFNTNTTSDTTTSSLDVSDDTVPFSEATRFEISSAPSNYWSVQMRTGSATTDYRSVSKGDLMLGVVYFRAPSGDATVKFEARNSNASEFNATTIGQQTVSSSEWQRYYFPIQWDAAADAPNWNVQIQLGFAAQTVDVGGIALLDFDQHTTVDKLPNGVAEDDDYYGELFTDLKNMGLPSPEFVHGDTEVETLNAFNTNTTSDTTTSSIDLSGDSVPFSEATRFEISSAPSNYWGVQMRTGSATTDYRSVSNGDLMLGVVYFRAPSGDATIKFEARNSNGQFNSTTIGQQTVSSSEWQRYYFPIQWDAAADAPNWNVQIQLGFAAQTVDVGGIALLDFDQKTTVDQLPSGAASDGSDSGGGAPGPSSWPSPSEPYYSWLVNNFQELGLQPGEFLYSNSESSTWNSLFIDAGSFGTTSSLDVSDDTVPFSEATRFDITSDPANPYDVQVYGEITSDISKGEVLLGVAYLRAPDGDAQAKFTVSNDSNFQNDVVDQYEQPDITGEWQRFYFPVEYSVSSDIGTLYAQFQLGYGTQRVDVGGFALLSFGTDANVSDLPGGVAEDNDYYGELFTNVKGMGLPTPEYVIANSESEVRSSSSTFATAGDYGTASDLDVSGDDVPFSEATRFDVTSQPPNAYNVQFRADIPRDVSSGQVMLAVAYLKSSSDSPEASFWAVDSGGFSNAVSHTSPEVGSEWERHYFPIEFGADTTSDQRLYVQFRFGAKTQQIDFGGFALMDFGTNADVSNLPSGVPKPEKYTEWPSVDDPYYSTLVSDLKDENLPAAGRFVYANNEADTFGKYELLTPDQGSPGAATRSSLDVSGDDVPFSKATRIDVTEKPENAYEISFKGVVENRKVNSGDVLLGVAYLRTSDDERASINYKSTENDSISANYVTKSRPAVPKEWQRFYFPIEFQSDGNQGEWFTEFWVGQAVQTVDIGGIALIDFAQGVGVNELPEWQASPASGWEKEADQLIEKHRKANVTVNVTDQNGDPVEGVQVEVSQQEHEFGFGTAIAADHLLNNTSEGDKYRTEIKRLFNTAVLENAHKWRQWENNKELADQATQWALDQGMDVRGHVCLWASVDSYAVPADVVDAMGLDHPSGTGNPNLDPGLVESRTKSHIKSIINHYGDAIEEWEVVNELQHEPGFVRAINGVPADQSGQLDFAPVEAPIQKEWFNVAREAAPGGQTLAINDYNTLVGPYSGQRDAYETQIQTIQNSEAGLDSAGLQSHFGEGTILLPSQIMSALDTYAQYDITLQITEFDMVGENWAEEDKAEFFHWFLKTVFSHPAVDEFLVWGIIDSVHWQNDAPFYASGWKRKPALDEYEKLVFEEWWTDTSGQTGSDGKWSVSAFKGEHEVNVTHDGQTQTRTVSLTQDATVDLTVQTTSDGSGGTGSGNTSTGNETTAAITVPGGQPGFGTISALAGLGGLGTLGAKLLGEDDEEDEDA